MCFDIIINDDIERICDNGTGDNTMSVNYDVYTTCLRYVVPFKFEDTFENALKKVEKQKEVKKNKVRTIWERRTAEKKQAESDLYDYIRNEFRFLGDDTILSEEKLGAEWIFWRSDEASSKDGQRIKGLLYYPEGLKKKKDDNPEGWIIPESWNVTVTNLGLMLFRNGLGMVWYELKVPQNRIKSDQLKKFQNDIRELSRSRASVVWEKQEEEPEMGIVLSEKKGYKTYISPFSFANWINDIIGFLNIRYLAERKYSYSKMIKNNMNALKGLQNEVLEREESIKNEYSNAPDKAILFSYVSFEQSEGSDSRNDKYSLVYHITNGYKDSYHYSDEIANEIKSPFNDVYWYATQEGAAYLAWVGEDNKEVFKSLIPSKVRTDYFALYMKILYQSFSLLLYAEKIQTNILASSEKYIAEPLDKKITNLYGEINLFLTKSMATSVSHIHHQSEFYVYIKKQLRIQDDVESLTLGLNALDAIQREQRQREENERIQEAWQEEQRRDREAQEIRLAREEREKKSDGKLQAIMGLFALLGISSALVDCFDFISKFDPSGDFWSLISVTQGVEIGFIVIVGIISIIAICFSLKAIIDAFIDKDK